jgi:hypothetical protein
VVKVVRVVSFEEGKQSLKDEIKAMTPNERVQLLQELRNAAIPPDQRRIERCYQVVDLSKR